VEKFGQAGFALGFPRNFRQALKLFLENSTFFQESFLSLEYSTYICIVNQLNIFIMKKEMTAEQKAKKAAANKAYRERKKMQAQNWLELEKFEMSFEHKIRLFKNLKLEITNSYCASPGTTLSFTRIKNEDNKIIFRVKRTGRRTFFTTSEHLKAPAE
jgi:hypothetical protein